MFEKFFGKTDPMSKEDKEINEEINTVGQNYYNDTGESIQKEISADFERVKYNKDITPRMISFAEHSINQNQDELSDDLELGEYIEALLRISGGEKYNYNDVELALQFMRDVDTYKSVYPDQVKDDMSVGEFIYFLQKLEDEAYDFLSPTKENDGE